MRNSNNQLTAQIKTLLGNTTADLNQLNATITGVTKNNDNTLSAQISTSLGNLNINLNTLSASLTALDGTTATIQTDLGVVKTNVTDINAHVQSVNGTVATIQTDYGTLQGNILSMQGDIAKIETKMGIIDVPQPVSSAGLLIQPIMIIEIAAICAIVITVIVLGGGAAGFIAKLKKTPKIEFPKLSPIKSKGFLDSDSDTKNTSGLDETS
jgi:hypothetical protein